MTARSAQWLKDNFMNRDPYDYNVDLVDSMGLWEETLTIGSDGDGDDVIFYGDTVGSQLHWDADTDTLELDGTTPKFRLGDFSGSTSGAGSVLSAANTAAFRVYADDGGAAIGSGTLARAGVFRNLLTYTGGNREQEAAGVIGQVVSVAGTNRHNMAGTWGSYEARTSLVVDGQAATTDTWAQAAIIARVGVGSGITTINANGVLAGVAAMSNTASFAANNGVYAGYYVGAWSGAADWAYGMYMEAGAVTDGIYLSATTQAHEMLVTALPADARGARYAFTCATPAMSDGYGAHEIDLTVGGVGTGGTFASSAWINAGAAATLASGNNHFVHNDGIWLDNSATATGGVLGYARVQFAFGTNTTYSTLHLFDLNLDIDQNMTSLFNVNNLALTGFTAGAHASAVTGSIPFIGTGGSVKYIRVYDSAA